MCSSDLCARSPAVTPQVAEAFLEGLEAHARRLAENPRTGFSTKSNWGVMEYTGLYAISWVLGPANVGKHGQHQRIRANGQVAYCVEPGKSLSSGNKTA